MAESGTPHISIRTIRSLTDIAEDQWTRFSGTDNPFVQHSFLLALEVTGCTTPATGWTPSHLAFYLDGRLAGVAPAYLKTHSMGEYVFDWAWAEAYQRYGVVYYPKLLMAIPFTPCQGPRLLLSQELRTQLHPDRLHQLLDEVSERLDAPSWHLLFPDQADQALLGHAGQLHRIGCQFHWYNRQYQAFDDFLATLTSRKRKSIRRERRQVAEQGIHFTWFTGTNLPGDVVKTFVTFYRATYLKRGQRPYLSEAFFQRLCQTQPEQVHILMAWRGGRMIAGALFLTGDDVLYGRYWGCLEEYDHLHFEACYYQGIERAIELGLSRFDAGAQGEHKLVRGFEPVITHSWHHIAHPSFREAIVRFTEEEAEHVMAYFEDAIEALPYKHTDNG